MELNNIFSKYFIPAKKDSSKIDCGLCKKCKGFCCKSMGCHISPHDLKEITVESIIALIDESKCISIDWWEGNPITNESTGEEVYFLRIKNKECKIVDPSYGGTCSILKDSGCPLSYEYRPKGARELIPNKDADCIDGYSKQQCAIDWYPYKEILEKVCLYYLDKGERTNNFLALFKQMLEGLIDYE